MGTLMIRVSCGCCIHLFKKQIFWNPKIYVYSGQSGHLFRFKAATDRSEATLDAHYTSLWPE